jgi:hypothetical protein
MTELERMEALAAAEQILRAARHKAFGVNATVWSFLVHAVEHVSKQQEAILREEY